MPVKAVLFDVDGVLVEPWRFRRVLDEDFGIDPQRTAGFFRGPFVQCVLGRADLRAELAPHLETWGWRATLDDFLKSWFAADGLVRPRVIEAVRRLRSRGFPVHVASTQELLRAEHLRRALGFDVIFDGLFFSCDLGSMKPDVRFYDSITRALGMEPCQLLFFDDHLENVRGARAAGWQAEHFTDDASFERRLDRLS